MDAKTLFDLIKMPAGGKMLTKIPNPLYPLDEDELIVVGLMKCMAHGSMAMIFSEKKVELGCVPKPPSLLYTDIQKLRNDSCAKFTDLCKKDYGCSFKSIAYPTINLTSSTCQLLIKASKEKKTEITIKTHCCTEEKCPMLSFCEAVALTWMENSKE